MGRDMATRFKIVVYVPLTHADAVREAMGAAGGGKIGKYSHCSFTTRGTGRFRPEAGANPLIGEVGKLEMVEEERIEMTCAADVVGNVIPAMKRAHPYDEIAFDVIELTDW